MFVIHFWYSDRSGIRATVGPFLRRADAELVAETLGAFADMTVTEVVELQPCIHPRTITPGDVTGWHG